jgi:hypothetical protein
MQLSVMPAAPGVEAGPWSRNRTDDVGYHTDCATASKTFESATSAHRIKGEK